MAAAHTRPAEPAPADPAFLAAPPQRSPPAPGQRPTKTRQHPPVPRHAAVLKPVVLKVASHHRPRPLAGLGWPRVHPRPQLVLNLRQLRPHSLPHRPAPHHKAPALPVDLANMRKPPKSKVSGLPSPPLRRFAVAQRPNSISRVFAGCSSSPNFASRSPPLFESFLGTTSRSDSSATCARDVRRLPFPTGLLFAAGAPEVSRFSCGEFPDLPRGS